MLVKNTIVGITTISIAIAGFYFGRAISASDQLKLLELLISFASVVFAVVGVWLAIVFPNVMSGIYKNIPVEEKDVLIITAKRLLVPLFLTSFIAASSMLIRVLAEPLRLIPSITAGTCANGLLFSFILVANFYLFIALVIALAPGLQLLFDGMDVVKGEKRKNRYLSRTSRKNDS